MRSSAILIIGLIIGAAGGFVFNQYDLLPNYIEEKNEKKKSLTPEEFNELVEFSSEITLDSTKITLDIPKVGWEKTFYIPRDPASPSMYSTSLKIDGGIKKQVSYDTNGIKRWETIKKNGQWNITAYDQNGHVQGETKNGNGEVTSEYKAQLLKKQLNKEYQNGEKIKTVTKIVKNGEVLDKFKINGEPYTPELDFGFGVDESDG